MEAEVYVKRASILVVDDARDVLSVMSDLLRLHDFEVTEVSDGGAAITHLASEHFDVVLTDLEMPVAGGMDVLAEARRRDPDTPVVMVTGYGTVERAVRAIREGAFDFVLKPVRSEDLLAVVERALEERQRSTESQEVQRATEPAVEPPFMVESPAMRRVMEQVARVAASDTTVLLVGESGTGKEMLSRMIHARSPRRDGPLVVINCAAIPSELMENELFGSEKGAFTGASQRKLGKFELAENGTILLDEVVDLNLSLQAKLLRVLEEKEFERLGGTRTIPLNVRVVTASNRELAAEVEAGRFRDDLFYRLNVFPIHLPPLRERREDVAVLVNHFVEQMRQELSKPIRSVSEKAMAVFENHVWPGNVRELRNVVERAVILCDRPVLEPCHVVIHTEVKPAKRSGDRAPAETLRDVSRSAAAEAEIELIKRVLEQVRWNRRKAARCLGVSYKTLWNKLKEYNLG